MKLLERLTQRMASTASVTVVDSVKKEVKSTAANALPVIMSVAAVIAGIIIFAKTGRSESLENGIGQITVTTNNYFFDGAAKAEMLDRILNQ